MAEQKELKRIKVSVPKHDFFFLAFPAPLKDLIDIAQRPVEMILVDGDKEIRVRRGDFFRYRLDQMSNLICRVTYGLNADETMAKLKQEYPYLTDESMVAFFLFERLRD